MISGPMQSHSLLATLWFELEERNDTTNILREILGQHTIELLTLDSSSQPDVQHALRPVYWIKAVFDIQRAYQQAAAYPNVPGMLSSELLYATLLHLLHVQAKLISGGRSEADCAGQHMLVLHTFLSGFRLLLLLNEQLDEGKLRRLQQALQDVLETKREIHESERFILARLVPASLAIPSATELQSGNAYCLTLRQMGLPTFSEGLYPLCLRPERLIELSFKYVSEGGTTWPTWYWTLFDSLWAAEAALLQYHVDHGEPSQDPVSPVSSRAPSPVDSRRQLQNGRNSLLLATFRNKCAPVPVPEACIIDSLKATVVEWWLDDNATTPLTQNVVQDKQVLEIRFALDAFRAWLRQRVEAIAPVDVCVRCSPAPTRQVPMNLHASERSNSIFFHKTPIHFDEDRTQEVGAMHHSDVPPSPDGINVSPTTARGLPSSAAGVVRVPSSPTRQVRLDSITSFNSHLSGATAVEDTCPPPPISPKVKRGITFRNALKASIEKDRRPSETCRPTTCRPTSFCFSSSGSALFLWGGNMRGFMKVRAPMAATEEMNDGSRWEIPAIKNITAGTDRCVVLASHQERYKLICFVNDKPRAESEITLDMPLRHHTDCCMAMSRDDKFLALAFDDNVRLYQISAGHIRRIRLHEQVHLYQHLAQERRLLEGPAGRLLSSTEAAREAQNQSSVVEQKLSFSPSGKSLIVATHLADHYIYVDVYRTDTEPCTPLSSQPKTFKLPPFTANDGGLTNIFFDESTCCALVSADIAKDYPNILHFTGTLQHVIDDSFGTKLIEAAQSADANFIVATGLTELIHMVINPDGSVATRRLKKCAAKIPPGVFKPENIVLAAPAPGRAFAFWIKDSKMVLRDMDTGQATESYVDHDIRPLVDRLFSEPVEPIVLSSTLPPVQKTLGEPISLHRETSLRLLAELPGSLQPIAELAAHD